jgi:hypothetical protein
MGGTLCHMYTFTRNHQNCDFVLSQKLNTIKQAVTFMFLFVYPWNPLGWRLRGLQSYSDHSKNEKISASVGI